MPTETIALVRQIFNRLERCKRISLGQPGLRTMRKAPVSTHLHKID